MTFLLPRLRTRLDKMLQSTILSSRRNGKHYPVSVTFSCVKLLIDKDWHSEYERIASRIAEGEARRNKQDSLERMLNNKIESVRYPMQELELNYPTTKGKIYSEEEDRYLLCRLNYYGLKADDVYERIKKDITEFPVFRFDWFFKSRTPQELQRRCNTLLGLIEKEAEAEALKEKEAREAREAKARVKAEKEREKEKEKDEKPSKVCDCSIG